MPPISHRRSEKEWSDVWAQGPRVEPSPRAALAVPMHTAPNDTTRDEGFWVYFYASRAKHYMTIFGINIAFLFIMLITAIVVFESPTKGRRSRSTEHLTTWSAGETEYEIDCKTSVDVITCIFGWIFVSATCGLFFFCVEYFPHVVFNSSHTSNPNPGSPGKPPPSGSSGPFLSPMHGYGPRKMHKDDTRSIANAATGLASFLLIVRVCSVLQTALFCQSFDLHPSPSGYSQSRIILGFFLDQV